jgi:hypothetical protein
MSDRTPENAMHPELCLQFSKDQRGSSFAAAPGLCTLILQTRNPKTSAASSNLQYSEAFCSAPYSPLAYHSIPQFARSYFLALLVSEAIDWYRVLCNSLHSPIVQVDISLDLRMTWITSHWVTPQTLLTNIRTTARREVPDISCAGSCNRQRLR